MRLKSRCVVALCLQNIEMEIVEREHFQLSENNLDYSNALMLKALILQSDHLERPVEQRLEEARLLLERALRIKLVLNGDRSVDYLYCLYFYSVVLRR